MNNFYDPPSNPEDFSLYYTDRQSSIDIPNKFVKEICGKNNSNLRRLEQQYNVSISLINIWTPPVVEFLFTHNEWLKRSDPNNKMALCMNEVRGILIDAKLQFAQNTTYGCKSCLTNVGTPSLFTNNCSICEKKRGCNDCKNEDGTYDNLCEFCGRENCCPTCLQIDGTVLAKCECCNRK